MNRNFEVRYWMQVFGVSRAALERAVRVVGSHAESVRRYLVDLEQDHRHDMADETAPGDRVRLADPGWPSAGAD